MKYVPRESASTWQPHCTAPWPYNARSALLPEGSQGVGAYGSVADYSLKWISAAKCPNSIRRTGCVSQYQSWRNFPEAHVWGLSFSRCEGLFNRLLQFRVLGFGLLVNGYVGIGVFPQLKKIFVRFTRGGLVAHHRLCAAEL